MTSPRVVQLVHSTKGRKIALVEEPLLRILHGAPSLYEWAINALQKNRPLSEMLLEAEPESHECYDTIYSGLSEWRLLPAFDHPEHRSRCLVSGTGLTHDASAKNRDTMHENATQATTDQTDSRKMFEWGRKGGKPPAGKIGIQPEWFYKGNGAILRGHGESLDIETFAEGGGEEPEIVGLYLIDSDGAPRRIGYAAGNEFSDHTMEQKNYLYLAPSKLRQASIGPEALIGELPAQISGMVSIYRGNECLWSSQINTGEANMTHSLANLEHHHFKYPQHRQPGDVHVYFFGADSFSFGSGIFLQQGDTMSVEWNELGRPLINSISDKKEIGQHITIVNPV